MDDAAFLKQEIETRGFRVSYEQTATGKLITAARCGEKPFEALLGPQEPDETPFLEAILIAIGVTYPPAWSWPK